MVTSQEDIFKKKWVIADLNPVAYATGKRATSKW
jgi:hypothetical protein